MTKGTDLSTVIVIPIGDTAAEVVCGGYFLHMYYCACTHEGYKVINNTILVVVL